VIAHQVAERQPGQWPRRDNALTIRVICDFPAFRVIVLAANWLVQQRTQPTSTPANSFQNGLEQEWGKHSEKLALGVEIEDHSLWSAYQDVQHLEHSNLQLMSNPAYSAIPQVPALNRDSPHYPF
jgi:hypothetical protein